MPENNKKNLIAKGKINISLHIYIFIYTQAIQM